MFAQNFSFILSESSYRTMFPKILRFPVSGDTTKIIRFSNFFTYYLNRITKKNGSFCDGFLYLKWKLGKELFTNQSLLIWARINILSALQNNNIHVLRFSHRKTSCRKQKHLNICFLKAKWKMALCKIFRMNYR